MNRTFDYVIYFTKISALAFGILILPHFYFQYEDQRLFREIKEMDMNVFQMDRMNRNALTTEEKRALLSDGNVNLRHIELKTGDRYSLYEARRQCFRELCKIPVLEVSIYGPILNEIDITPCLLIDPETPSISMITWKGFLTIKDIKYQITLEEESGKVLSIQPVGKVDDVLNMQWERYLKEPQE